MDNFVSGVVVFGFALCGLLACNERNVVLENAMQKVSKNCQTKFNEYSECFKKWCKFLHKLPCIFNVARACALSSFSSCLQNFKRVVTLQLCEVRESGKAFQQLDLKIYCVLSLLTVSSVEGLVTRR